MIKLMNHAEYQKNLKKKSIEALRYIIADCRETLKVNPEGVNSGYYMDEIHYAAAELRNRGEK
jgi:hypothetical protein